MKKLIFTIILLTGIIGCENENEKQEKFFDPKDIPLLNLADIDGFWENDSIIDTTYYAGGLFERYPGFLEGINLYGENNAIRIAVFSTQDTSINAMESRISNVAEVIEKGTSDEIKGTWWFVKNTVVFVNQWNTIIEVVIYCAGNEDVQNILFSTANELAKRVDNLSR